MKNLRRNKGFTLVELVVSIAILAFIMIAIIGLMYSNNVIFKKTKSDVNIQNVAQDSYSKLSSDIMQAKYIAIEGYVADNPSQKIEFKSTGVDNESTVDITLKQLMRQSDINIKSDKAPSQAYSDYINDVSAYSIKDVSDKNSTVTSNDIGSYYYNIRYMDDTEKTAYKNFFLGIDGTLGSSNAEWIDYTKISSFESLKSTNPGGDPKYNIQDVYVTKIMISSSVKIDNSYCTTPTTDKYETGLIIYEFNKNEMKITYNYTHMDKLNGTQVYTDKLNYVVDDSKYVSGVVAKVDSDNNSIGISMDFAKESMTYNVEGVVGIRNSYVLNNAN